MKELTNGEINRLQRLIGTHSPYELARLSGGDLSHIGRGILEGRKVSFGSIYFNDASTFSYNGNRSDYRLSPKQVMAIHYGDEIVEGISTINSASDKSITMTFKDIGFRNSFLNKLNKKEVKYPLTIVSISIIVLYIR